MDDRELWERICRGDTRAFDGFYRENVARLNGFLRQLLGNTQTAEDVSQETFLQLWRRPDRFHPENGTLRCYLYGIGRKRAADWWRQSSHASEQCAEPSQAATMETCSLIRDAISRLREEQRSLLWLREVEGLSYVELAGILEIPVGTVRSRLFAAREELRTIWRGARQALKEGT